MKLVAAAVLAVFTALPASAVIVECNLNQRPSAWGWFAPTVQFQYEAGDDKAMVNDAVIQEKHGKPIQADIEDDSNAKTTFVWTVKAKSRDKQFKAEGDSAALTTFNQVRFRLTYFKAGGTANASANLNAQNVNAPSTDGTCRTLN